MAQGDAPAVARHRVRRVLRAAREAKQLTQGQIARALDWSLSKVQRIESGEVSVSTTDLRSLLAYLDITDGDTVRRLMEGARMSRRQRWFTDPKYREHLTGATRQMLQFESEAAAIRAFHPTVLPGLLQTADYSQAIYRSKTGHLSEATQEVRHEVRMRRKSVLTREHPPQYFLIIDESVLWREYGSVCITADQFADLLTVARQPHVHVRVLPFAKAAAVALLGPFTLFDLGDDADAVLYTEVYDDDEVIQQPHKVERHRVIFEDLWKRSLDEAATERLILARAATLMSSLDRFNFYSG